MVNTAVEGTLANAVATFDGGEPFGVVFARGVEVSLGLVEGCSVKAGFDLRRAPGLKRDGVLVIDGTPYRAVAGVEPDSSGWVNVQLREV